MSFWKDITSTKDGESFDIGRVAMTLIIGTQPFVLVWALGLQTLSFLTGKPFDLKAVLEADQAFLLGVGGFLLTAAAALHVKKSTEPNDG